MIRAAGVILWREKRPFELEIALVHRAKFDDWTFPKGNIEDGGSKPVFGPFIGHAEYEVEGDKKKVQYWMAKAPDED